MGRQSEYSSTVAENLGNGVIGSVSWESPPPSKSTGGSQCDCDKTVVVQEFLGWLSKNRDNLHMHKIFNSQSPPKVHTRGFSSFLDNQSKILQKSK